MLAYADKRLTIFNTYTQPTDPPIAHLRGQHPLVISYSFSFAFVSFKSRSFSVGGVGFIPERLHDDDDDDDII